LSSYPFDDMLVLMIIEKFILFLYAMTVIILLFVSSVMFPFLTDKFLNQEAIRNGVHDVDEINNV